MGNRNASNRTLSDYDIRIYSQQSQLPPHIVQQLYEAFMERSGSDGRMTLSDFKKCYAEINPNVNIFNLDNDAERVFMMFDLDHNGVLTFNEFILAYILLQRGGDAPATRWQYALNIIPAGFFSRPGLLNSAEALKLLQYLNQFYQIPNFDPVTQHTIVWAQLIARLDPSGYIPQADFLQLLSTQPQIQPYIW